MRTKFTRLFTSRIFVMGCSIVSLLLSNSLSNHVFAQALPMPDHIVILIEENQPNFLVIGNTSAAPYINQIANDTSTALFTKMYAIEHPSQGNYLDFFAGSNQGILDDNLPANYPFVTDNLARQLLDHGLTFKTYSEDLPSVGFDGVSSGSYVRKHNPVTNWVGTGTNQVPDSLNQPMTAFPTDFNLLPTVSYVVPNEANDMHDGFGNPTITLGDTWFHTHLDAYVQWCKNHNSLFIFTFDEDDGLAANNIPTFFTGEMVQHGTYTDHWTLYSMLRTMEDMYGLRYAGNAASNVPILNCWKQVSTGLKNLDESTQEIKVYPNPSSTVIKFDARKSGLSEAEVSVTDITGKVITQQTLSQSNSLEVNTSAFAVGIYFYQVTEQKHLVQTGKFSVIH